MHITPLVIALTFLVAFAQTASGAQQVYFGRDASKADLTNANAARSAFLAQLASFGEESVESLGGTTNPLLTFGATGITATTANLNGQNAPGFTVSGSHALLDIAGGASDPPLDGVMSFSQPITALGAYFVQGGDGAANTLTLRLENTLLATSTDVMLTLGPGWEFFNVFFLGVTDTDPFDRVTLMESHDVDGMLLDDLLAGTLVPEPSGFALLAAGAVVAALAGRYSGSLRSAGRRSRRPRLRRR